MHGSKNHMKKAALSRSLYMHVDHHQSGCRWSLQFSFPAATSKRDDEIKASLPPQRYWQEYTAASRILAVWIHTVCRLHILLLFPGCRLKERSYHSSYLIWIALVSRTEFAVIWSQPRRTAHCDPVRRCCNQSQRAYMAVRCRTF